MTASHDVRISHEALGTIRLYIENPNSVTKDHVIDLLPTPQDWWLRTEHIRKNLDCLTCGDDYEVKFLDAVKDLNPYEPLPTGKYTLEINGHKRSQLYTEWVDEIHLRVVSYKEFEKPGLLGDLGKDLIISLLDHELEWARGTGHVLTHIKHVRHRGATPFQASTHRLPILIGTGIRAQRRTQRVLTTPQAQNLNVCLKQVKIGLGK